MMIEISRKHVWCALNQHCPLYRRDSDNDDDDDDDDGDDDDDDDDDD